LSTVEQTALSVSSLAAQIGRAGSILQNDATEQIEAYKSKFEALEGLYDRLFKDLIVSGVDYASAFKTAKQFFGTSTVPFAAIDGTDYARPLFDLVVFFGGSYASTGTITFHEKNPPGVDYNDQYLKNGIGVSSCVPVYVSEVPEIDQSFIQPGESTEISLVRPLTDDSIVNNSTIPTWMMTFSEFYLAYKLATKPGGPQILFLDRSLATTLASLIYDTSRRKLWKSNGALVGVEVEGEKLDEKDLALARHHVSNLGLDLTPPRGDYLRYRCLLTVEKSGPLTLEGLCKTLRITTSDRTKKVERFLKKSVSEGYLTEEGELYSFAPRYRKTWPMVRSLVETIGRIMFEETPGQNPLRIRKGDGSQWLTTQDMAFLTLFTLNLLVEECWKRHILLIGITKDTAARDLKNHVLPILVSNQIWKTDVSQERLARVPNTDRMLLQTLSLFSHTSMPIPWSLVEYDSAFLTIVPDFEKREGYVSGAIRNKITPERFFLKSYVQLSQADQDPQLRSNVLLIDRLAYSDFDRRVDTTLEFKHSYGADEPVNPIVFRNNNVPNRVQELVMVTLESMTSKNIPDLFGHNKPLFIADKVAKWQNESMRKVIDTTGKWLMNNPRLRSFVFYMSTFRERRSEIESTRREAI